MIIANIADFREAARRRLPHFLFEYVDGGSYAEETLRRNVADLAGIALDEGDAEALLHVGQRLAERGLGHPERCGRLTKMLKISHGDEGPKLGNGGR